MDVVQFYDGDVKDYKCDLSKVAYTGTHDNETFRAWLETRFADEIDIEDEVLEKLYLSDAKVVIIPLQDAAGLGNEARMNTPGTTDSNWKWKACESDLEKAGVMLKKYMNIYTEKDLQKDEEE